MSEQVAKTSLGDTPKILTVLPWCEPHTYDQNLVRGSTSFDVTIRYEENAMKQSPSLLRQAIGDEIRENMRHDGLPTLTPGEMADRILAVVKKYSPSLACEHPLKLVCTKDVSEDCTCTCVVCHGA